MTRVSYCRILNGIIAALFCTLVLGCSGTVTESRVGLADDAGSSSPAELCGTWQGSFGYSGDDSLSSWGSADLTLQIVGDSTYTFTWGNRPPSTGTVAARGNRVILDDASGSRITLVHSGDTLYGVMSDSASGRPAVMSLEKQGSVTDRFAEIGRGCAEPPVGSPGHPAQNPDSRAGAKPPVRARQR